MVKRERTDLSFKNLSRDFPSSPVVKTSPYNAGGAGLIPASGRSPREGNGNPFQYSCLENPIDKEALQAIANGVSKESDRAE